MSAPAKLQFVRVWLGPHSIAAYHADKDLADRYTTVMGAQFAGLRVTIESASAGEVRQLLPSDERQWPLTAFGGGGADAPSPIQAAPLQRRVRSQRHRLSPEGVMFSTGAVALHWAGDYPATAVWPDIESVIAVYGHHGATVIEWIDDEAGNPIEAAPGLAASRCS